MLESNLALLVFSIIGALAVGIIFKKYHHKPCLHSPAAPTARVKLKTKKTHTENISVSIQAEQHKTTTTILRLEPRSLSNDPCGACGIVAMKTGCRYKCCKSCCLQRRVCECTVHLSLSERLQVSTILLLPWNSWSYFGIQISPSRGSSRMFVSFKWLSWIWVTTRCRSALARYHQYL